MDSKNSYVGSILMFLNMFVLIVAMILLMIVGAYHLLFEEPERLPYRAVVYDRSNKAMRSGKRKRRQGLKRLRRLNSQRRL